MRRPASVLLLIALLPLVAGCSRFDPAAQAELRATKALAHADTLISAGQYDAARDECLAAARQVGPGIVRDEALRKASTAVTEEVANSPLPAQVAAMQTLVNGSPDRFLPLAAHNWLSTTLAEDAATAVAVARTDLAADAKLLAVQDSTTTSGTAGKSKKTAAAKKKKTKSTTPKAKTSAKKPSSKASTKTSIAAKPAAKKPAATPTPVVNAPVAKPVLKPAAAPAPAPVPIGFKMPSREEFSSVAAALPGLGQPPAMQQLYAALAEVRQAIDATRAARALMKGKKRPTPAVVASLRTADTRLVRALAAAQHELAAAR